MYTQLSKWKGLYNYDKHMLLNIGTMDTSTVCNTQGIISKKLGNLNLYLISKSKCQVLCFWLQLS